MSRLAVAAALSVSLAGIVFLGLMVGERGRSPGQASAGGLTLQVNGAQWTVLDHDQQDGFQMPAQMMPGAPAHGQRRLAVEVALLNRTDGVERYSTGEFALRDPDGRVLLPVGGDVGEQRLGPGLGVNASLAFDLPERVATQEAPELTLVWSRAGKVARLPLTVGATHGRHP